MPEELHTRLSLFRAPQEQSILASRPDGFAGEMH
jgi:hypothetical protein